MAGFTPKVSAAVWVGTGTRSQPIYNADGTPMYGSDEPARIWRAFMNGYLKGSKHQDLPTRQLISADGSEPAATPTNQPTYPTELPTDTPSDIPSTETPPSTVPPSSSTPSTAPASSTTATPGSTRTARGPSVRPPVIPPN